MLEHFFPTNNSLSGYFTQALAALLLAFAISLVLGKYTIAWLTRKSLNDGDPRKASDTLNEITAAAGKARTPTMGGLFILLSIAIAAALVLPWRLHAGWFILAAMLGSGMLGAWDDWIKLTQRKGVDGKRKDGLSGKTKLVVQTLLYGACAYGLWTTMPVEAQRLWLPLVGGSIELGWLMIPLAIFVCVGSSNAVNLTDGLDGLAGGLTFMVSLAFVCVAFIVGNSDFAASLGCPLAPDAGVAGLVAALTCGAVLGFLWYNVHPAQVFMGDTGSLALGAGLGFIAVSLRQELLLAVLGAVFVAEAMSVMLQVAWFKLSGGRRIFRCSPLHHHFQFAGWKETKVTLRFWLIGALFCAGGLGLLAIGAGSLSADPSVIPANAGIQSHPQISQIPQIDADVGR